MLKIRNNLINIYYNLRIGSTSIVYYSKLNKFYVILILIAGKLAVTFNYKS